MSARPWSRSAARFAWSETTTWRCSTSSTSRPSRRPPPRRSAGRGRRRNPATLDFLGGLEPADETHDVALYHASPRDPVWEYVLWPDQAAECIGIQAARVSLVGHSHVALFFVMSQDGSRPAGRGDRSTGRGPRRPGRGRDRARSRRGPLADQPRQRRPAARRRPPGRLARARHRPLGCHLPPGRVRDRPGRRRDHARRTFPTTWRERLYVGQ